MRKEKTTTEKKERQTGESYQIKLFGRSRSTITIATITKIKE